VKAHGGSVSARSAGRDQGSELTVVLPAAAATAAATTAAVTAN